MKEKTTPFFFFKENDNTVMRTLDSTTLFHKVMELQMVKSEAI